MGGYVDDEVQEASSGLTVEAGTVDNLLVQSING